jgi:hypothetical protein
MTACRSSNKRRKQKRFAQLNFLMENFTDPCFLPVGDSQTPLNNAFNMSSDLEGYNPTGITMAILNWNPKQGHRTEDDLSAMQVSYFMRKIQNYLPYNLRMTRSKPSTPVRPLWLDSFENRKIDDDTREIVEEFIPWLYAMRSRIEDELTTKFLLGGKLQFIETLKRRYKETWSEKTESEQTVQQNVSGGMNIQISFEDVDEQTN